MKVGTDSIGSELWGFFLSSHNGPRCQRQHGITLSLQKRYIILYIIFYIIFKLSFTLSFQKHYIIFYIIYTEGFHYRWENGRQLSLLSNYRKE